MSKTLKQNSYDLASRTIANVKSILAKPPENY